MKTKLLTGVLLLSPLFGWAAGPAFDVKPGLWEVSSTVQMSGMPPIPNLDQLTPEQRARVESAMKNMSGKPTTSTTKSCVTKEGIEKAIAEASSNRGNSCKPKLVNMTSSKVELHIDCSEERGSMKSNGDMVIERVDSEHFQGNGGMKMSGAGGRTMDMKWSMSGKYVSADCGSVKP